MGNKDGELACLNLAIEKCLKQKGFSKKIGLMLSGNDVERDNNEAPDFLRCYKPTNCNGKSVIIGIEHYRVDHYSEKLRNKKVSSLGVQYENEVKKSIEKWKPELSEDTEIPDNVLSDFSDILLQAFEQRIQATYNTFISAFGYSLNKHLPSIDNYLSVVNRYGGDCEKKLALLLEVHTDFSQLFYHDHKGIHHNDNIIPIFEDIVEILETVDNRKVDYLILCFGKTIYDDTTKVVAISTSNIRKQLQKLHIPIYHYAGHDIFLSEFQTPRLDLTSKVDYKRNEGGYDFHISITSRDIKDESRMDMIIGAYRFIKIIECKGMNYATTEPVEMFYELFDEYVPQEFQLSSQDIVKIIASNIFNRGVDLDEKYRVFNKKWDRDKT